jgi:protein-disulfide isomerase
MHRTRILLVVVALGLLLMLALARRAANERERYDLPESGHEKGAPTARIVILEFADFSCAACAAFAQQTLPSIEREWIATGRARLRIIPFDALGTGRSAARAAECAAQQNAFWPMHDLLFARQKEWLGRRGQRDQFIAWATQLGLDPDEFRACWSSDQGKQHLERNTRLARQHGVPGTPAFAVNGRALVGALPYPEFQAALEAAVR